MIQAFDDWIGGLLYVALIDQESPGRIHFTFNDDVKAERMAVQSPAFVVGRKSRQIVCRLKAKGFAQSHAHRVARNSRKMANQWETLR